jgi:ABC-2 type transport system ATP-binding protein
MNDKVLKIRGLSKVYRSGFSMKKIVALKNLNMDISRHEIFGFLGPNGAGKSTIIKCILGLIHPTAGDIEILGTKVGIKSSRAVIGYLPENPYFYDYLTGKEFLTFCGKLFKIEKKLLNTRVSELLKRVELSKFADVVLKKYSKGMKQRVGFAQALINDPELIFLDEPMSGLDPVGRRLFRETIMELKERGKTIFLNSHIMSDVEMICDRVGILIKGQLMKIGTLEEMLGDSVASLEINAELNDNCLLKLKDYTTRIMEKEKKHFIFLDSEEKLPEVLEIIRNEKGKIHSIIPIKKTLEEFFLEEIIQAERNARN